MGQVYLAQSPGAETVALKVLSAKLAADPGQRAVFTNGVAAARAAGCVYSPPVIDVELDGPRMWVATAYVPGPTLQSLVAYGPFPGHLLLALAAGVARGLREIHAAGVVHRDLTPSNIVLGSDGPRIVDFGIAVKAELVEPTGKEGAIGTPGFMSPEQMRGDTVGPATDVFSFGAVLAFAATGKGPFESIDMRASLFGVMNDESRLATMGPIWPLLSRCLAKDPSGRPSATELADTVYDLAAREFGLSDAALGGVMRAIPGWSGLEPRDSRITRPGYRDPTSRVMDQPRAGHDVSPFPPTAARYGASWPAPAAQGGYHSDYQSWPGRSVEHEMPPVAEEASRIRFLTGILPGRAPSGARISLQVMITLQPEEYPSSRLKEFPIPAPGAALTITVASSGLIPLGDLEQDLFVPFREDSEPIRFGFVTGPAGLHSVVVRAFSGGTFLGELSLQISVEPTAALEEGRSQTAVLAGLVSEPGEVTLQVSRTDEDRYSFQLIGEEWNRAEVTRRLAGDPTQVVGALIEELRAMSANQSRFTSPHLVRNRMRNLGAQLWADVVPEAIQRQFWAQRDKIGKFTIASDMDTVPWELLYPVDHHHDNGFLVDQFPVVRRVYDQGRTRVLRLGNGAAYIVPPGSPANAMTEVDSIRGIFPANVRDRGVLTGLAEVIELLGTAPSVLHFACHNAFTEQGGSVIGLEGGPLRPSDLSVAVQQKALAAANPLVFLNACRTAGDITGLTQLMGWARQFMGAGAGAFIGSLWAVRSNSAKTFAEALYSAMVTDRLPLGAASLRARQAISSDPGDPTWLAYTVYGSPSASIDHEQPQFGQEASR